MDLITTTKAITPGQAQQLKALFDSFKAPVAEPGDPPVTLVTVQLGIEREIKVGPEA